MHVGRVLGYGVGGLLGEAELGASAVLAVSILIGNVLGRRLRDWLGAARCEQVTRGTLLVSLAAGVLALTR